MRSTIGAKVRDISKVTPHLISVHIANPSPPLLWWCLQGLLLYRTASPASVLPALDVPSSINSQVRDT